MTTQAATPGAWAGREVQNSTARTGTTATHADGTSPAMLNAALLVMVLAAALAALLTPHRPPKPTVPS